MKRTVLHRATLAVVAIASGLLVPAVARAQAGPSATPPATPPGAGAQAAPTPGSTYVPMPGQAGQPQGGWGNPQAPNGTIGGGNATESSAHPITGDQQDTFDLGTHGHSGGAVHGDENGPMFLGGSSFGGETPYSHIVRRGDTLWGICGYYFQNPYQWPRVWSFNPQIKNPHWIYPGDEVRLKSGEGDRANATAPKPALPYQGVGSNLVDRRRQVPHGSIFLRDQGWIHDPADEVWGDVTGADADRMFLSDRDELYLHIDKGHEVHMGQELTVFRPLHMGAAGMIVQISGTARIDQWNAQDRIARAKIIESLNVIERGAKVGPLDRSFNWVPPKRNEVDVQAHVLSSLHPNEFYGENQLVFIDKGEEAGLKVGNRLFVMRRGDAWRRTLVTAHAGDRVSPDDDRRLPPMEQTPGSRSDEPNYPEEVVGEMRVVIVKKDSATCILTHSRKEIETQDVAVARKGY